MVSPLRNSSNDLAAAAETVGPSVVAVHGPHRIPSSGILWRKDVVKQTAVVVVHHVPPSHPNLQFPADWMQVSVADSANNWVEVRKTKDGKYHAGVGKETFDVTITLSTADGKILSASMDNPVVMSSRDCDDAALTKCGAVQPHTIHRRVEIALEH